MIATAMTSSDYVQSGVSSKRVYPRNAKKAFDYMAGRMRGRLVPVEYRNGDRLIFTRMLRRPPIGLAVSFDRHSWGKHTKWNTKLRFHVKTKNAIEPPRAPCWVVYWIIDGKPESIVRCLRQLAEKYAAIIGCAKVKHLSQCRWHPYYPKRKVLK